MKIKLMTKILFHYSALKIYRFITNFYFLFIKRKNAKKLEEIKEKIKNGSIKTVYFNRTDRIGDAIVSLPFFLAFKKNIKTDFVVLSSSQNDWVLKPFVSTSVQDIKLEETSVDYYKKIYKVISGKYKKTKSDKECIFLDVKNDYNLYNKFSKCYHVNFKNFALNLKYSDYMFERYLSSDVCFDENMNLLTERVFGKKIPIEEFPKELRDYVTKNHDKKIEKYISKNFIIVFVGNKHYRNLDKERWSKLINKIKFEGKILVVDDPNRAMIGELKKDIKGKNVVFVEESFNLWSLMYLASKSKLVFGIDGGGFNFLQAAANAFEIIMYTNQEVWKPYSNNPYKVIFNKNKHIIKHTTTSQNLQKYLYYIDSKIKIIYETMQIADNPVRRILNINLIAGQINKILKNGGDSK